MELMASVATLGDPTECRAFIAHHIADFNEAPLKVYAKELVSVQHRWIFVEEYGHRQKYLMTSIQEVLKEKNFNPIKDYVVLGGDAIIGAAMVWHFGSINMPVCVLRYDRKTSGYVPFLLGV